jgi:hypothetical protein
MQLLASLVLLGWGAFCFLARDVLWDWTVVSNQTKGVASERSEMWDLNVVISGVVAIGLGLFLLYAFFTG